MNRLEIVFAGVGGQGLLLIANLLGKAASILEGNRAVMSCAYGSETRGTFTKADLILSSEDIDFPEVLDADAVVALAQVAYDRYCAGMKEGSVIIYDSCTVTEKTSAARQIGLPLSDIASAGGSKGSLNIAALGALIGATGCSAPDSILTCLAEQFKGKEKVIAMNNEIFNNGCAAAKNARCQSHNI